MIGTLGSDGPADLEAVDARQHQVEHDQVGRLAGRGLDRGPAVVHDRDAVALADEVALDDLGHDRLVVDDQDALVHG